MTDSWTLRVSRYVDDLEQLAGNIASILEKTPVNSPDTSAEGVNQSTQQLVESIAALEHKIAVREGLLQAGDAPREGLTLATKLRSTGKPADDSLAQRCDQVAELVSDVNHRAVSIFVCQYHLANLSEEILSIISGTTAPVTYQRASHGSARSGGGLFNEAG